MEVEFLPTCGAAQEKQSAAALPSLTPSRPPRFLCLACFRPLATTGRHPKNWLSGNPTAQPAVQAAGTNLDEDGASAVANAQTPQPGSVGPLDDLSAGPFTERVALWLHGYFHARTRGAHCTQRGHGNRRSPFLYGYQRRFDGGFAEARQHQLRFRLGHAAGQESPVGPLYRQLPRVHSFPCQEHDALIRASWSGHQGRDEIHGAASLVQETCLAVATASRGAPEFVECHVISTWCAYFLVLRWVPRGLERGVSDPTAQFVLSSGELGIGRPCCAAQADRDLSETPPRHGRWSTTEDESAGVWGVWAKHRRGCSLRDGRGRCAPLDADGTPHFPLREKVCPHSACTHPQRAHSAHTHDSARCTTRHVHCHMHVCGLWRCGLVSTCD